MKTQQNDQSCRMLLCAKRTDEIVGMINLNLIARGPFQNAVMGYWLGACFVGRGFMTEGIKLGLRHAFGTLALHRVEANVMPHNKRSLSVVRRAGFREEGFSPRYLEIDGQWRDHIRFAMTIEDWKRPKSTAQAV